MHCVFEVALWSVRALAAQKYPSARHDAQPWRPSDEKRRHMADTPIYMKVAFLFHKADWSEYSSSFGYPTWQDHLRPCYACTAFGAAMWLVMGNSAAGLRWQLSSDQDYEDACKRCEIEVQVVTEGERRAIIRALRYDKRDKGWRGRVLVEPLPAMGLQEGDRLEPGGVHPRCR